MDIDGSRVRPMMTVVALVLITLVAVYAIGELL